MLKDITLGQFFPGSSVVHRLDPRTKLLLTFLSSLHWCKLRLCWLLRLFSNTGSSRLRSLPLKRTDNRTALQLCCILHIRRRCRTFCT